MPSASRRPRQNRYPLLGDRDWLYERYVVQQVGPKAMAQEAGCRTTTAVLHALGLAGIPVHGHSGPPRGWEPTKEELLKAYAEAGTLPKLAEQQDVSVGTVRNTFGRLGLRAADYEPARNKYSMYPQLADRSWLESELYKKTSVQIAGELGCSSTVVLQAAKEHGLEAISRGHPRAVRDEAIKQYTNGITLLEVARLVGASQSMVWRWLHAAGVDTTIHQGRRAASASEEPSVPWWGHRRTGLCRHCGERTERGEDPSHDLCATCQGAGRT